MVNRNVEHKINVLKQAWDYPGIEFMSKKRGAFPKLRNFYFDPVEFEEVLIVLRSLPRLGSDDLPLEVVKYLWRMREFLLVYRENFVPQQSTQLHKRQRADIRKYDDIETQISKEIHRILGSPVAISPEGEP